MIWKNNISLLKELIKKVDMYGAPISLNFRSQTTHQSIVGGVSTLVTIVVIVILTFQGAAALVERSNSYIQTQTQFIFEPSQAHINTDQFQFYLGMDQGWSLKDKAGRNLFNITAEIINEERGKFLSSSALQMKNCEETDFQSSNDLNYSTQFQALGLSSAMCSAPGQLLSLKGRFQGSQYAYIKISLKENKEGEHGYNYEELQAFKRKMKLNSPTVRIGFTNSFLDTFGSQLMPLISETQYQLTNLKKVAYVDIPLEITTFNDDKSIIPKFQDVYQQVFVNAKPEMQINYKTPNKNQIEYAVFQIYLSQQEHYVYKSYDKIDMYLAYVGGIIQISMLVLGYFIKRYNQYAFYVSLANKLYTFDLHPSKNEKYGRQNADSEETFLTIDQIKKRLMNRIQKIKQTISRFKNGTRNMIKKNHIIMLLLQKHSVSIQSPSSLNKEQELNEDDQIQYDNFKAISENESESVSYIHQEPNAQRIRSNPQQINNLDSKGHLSSPILPLRFQDIKSNSDGQGPQPQIKKYLQFQKEESNVELDFSDKKTFLEQSFRDILKYTKQIRMSVLYMITKMFCRKIFYRQNETIQLLDKAIQMLKYDTDLVKILEKLQDIDKLKKIILNNDQLVVFNYTPKPIVKARRSIRRSLLQFETQISANYQPNNNQPVVKENQTLLQSKKHFHTIKSFFKLYNAYDRLFHSSQILSKVETQVNSRLMLLIGQDLREVFEVSQYLEDNHQDLEKSSADNINSESVGSFGSFTSIRQKSVVTSKQLMLSSFAKLNSTRKIG